MGGFCLIEPQRESRVASKVQPCLKNGAKATYLLHSGVNQLSLAFQESSTLALFREADLAAPVDILLPHGQAAILTRPHPWRNKPNQDAATIFSIGARGAFLAVADGMGGTRGWRSRFWNTGVVPR